MREECRKTRPTEAIALLPTELANRVIGRVRQGFDANINMEVTADVD